MNKEKNLQISKKPIRIATKQVKEEKSDYNILIVEDEPDLIYTYKEILQDEGYNVDTFTDPYAALRQFAEIDPSYYGLVLLDIRMPRLNGLQLYYRIKAINHNTKIIFVTALDVSRRISKYIA